MIMVCRKEQGMQEGDMIVDYYGKNMMIFHIPEKLTEESEITLLDLAGGKQIKKSYREVQFYMYIEEDPNTEHYPVKVNKRLEDTGLGVGVVGGGGLLQPSYSITKMTVQIEEHDKIKDNHINTTLVGVGDGPMHISHQNVTEKVPSPLGGVGHIRSYNLGPSLGRPDYYINEALAQKKLTPMPTIGLTYIDNLGAGPRMQEIEWTSSPLRLP